jgi:hypothetical protein
MPSASEFRHQDVSAVPPGFHVRTIRAGKHELRIAFPKGARKKGSGQLISILHPKKERNPETCGGHLNLVRAKIAAMEIPLEVVGNGFGRGFENALIETDAKNPMEIGEYWEKFKAKLSELIESAKDHGFARNPIAKRSKGHIAFTEEYEFFHGKGGKVYRAPLYAKIDRSTGYRSPAQFEATKSDWEAPGYEHRKRNYTEQVKTSDGRTVFIDVLESGGRWMAEGYPVIKGKVKHVGKPHVAYGASESAAYDALVEKLDKNPAKGRRKAKKNLDEIDAAAALAGEFKGSPAESVREVSTDLGKHRDDFAHLAWLYELVFHPAYDRTKLEPKAVAKVFHEIYENDDSVKTSTQAWEKTAKEFGTVFLVFDFSGDEIELVSTAKGEQLEFLGGNQASFAQHLGVFRVKPRHDRDDLGDLVGITYLAQKEQFGDTKVRPYYHVFGEDGGSFPRAFFDELNKRIVITGGSYRLDEAKLGIIN